MLKRLLMPAAAALIFGAVSAIPQPAAAATFISGAATATQSNAQTVSDVVEVRRRGRHHRAHRHHRRWRGPSFSYGRYYAPRAYYARRCGYVVRPHRGRVVYRCW